jgi:NAD(P)H-hydrate repair Nnr-like enzyme with NAD(P)H-hydrate dehydratase domain
LIYTHVATALLAALLGFAGAWRVQDWRQAANAAEQAEVDREARVQQARQADAAATSHEAFKAGEQARVQVITREVERVVEKPVYRNVCLDADGLKLLSDAVHGRAATDWKQTTPQ